MKINKLILSSIIIGTIAIAALLIFLLHDFFKFYENKSNYNIILIISDQQAFHLRESEGYHLPAHEELARRGVTFTNHYAAAAMCSPSRAALLTGAPPQVNGVTDQMGYAYESSLDPKRPNMGSVMKSLGYRTAYFGKFEMDKSVLMSKDDKNTSKQIQSYGFDIFNPDGDTSGKPRQGYYEDPYYVGEAIRWLHQHASNMSESTKPFFMVVSLLNPHDIMYADANIPNTSPAQQPAAPLIFPAPNDAMYAKKWQFTLPATLSESLTAKGMPSALQEYQNGWSTIFGFIPTNRSDMWMNYYNYYLNAIRDNDQQLQQVLNTLTDMDLWKNTIVIFTADHGDMGGTHGGLRGKGPMAYEDNAHIPLMIAHPDAAHGATCHAITSHIDLLPTLIGLTKQSSSVTKSLVGHDLSGLLTDPTHADIHAVRKAILFNYVAPSTVDSNFLIAMMKSAFGKQPSPSLNTLNKNKRGYLMFMFDGRYKFARFYAPNHFNLPTTLDELLQNNDVQLFDLQNDPDEANNLALNPDKNRDLLLKLNKMLNNMYSQEVTKQ